MTTLTQGKKHERFGADSKTTLSVSGAAGAIAAEFIDSQHHGAFASVRLCSPTGEPHDLLHEDCPIRGGRCYGESMGRSVVARAMAAWLDSDDAVYAVLEELYRREFSA